MIWYLIKYNSQGKFSSKGIWTEVSTETSYSSADARKEFLESKQTNPNISYLIVSSPQGKQYLPQIVECKLREQSKVKKVA